MDVPYLLVCILAAQLIPIVGLLYWGIANNKIQEYYRNAWQKLNKENRKKSMIKKQVKQLEEPIRETRPRKVSIERMMDPRNS